MRLSPTWLTSVGLVIALFSGYAFWTSGYLGSLLGSLLLLGSGFFDILDGAVARATGLTTKRGAFLDSTLDRVAEVAVYFGILLGGYAAPSLVLLTLSLSLLVSYTRSRAESLGVSLSGIGVGERSERLLVLALSGILGFVGYGVVLVALLAGVTFVQRTYIAASKLD